MGERDPKWHMADGKWQRSPSHRKNAKYGNNGLKDASFQDFDWAGAFLAESKVSGPAFAGKLRHGELMSKVGGDGTATQVDARGLPPSSKALRRADAGWS